MREDLFTLFILRGMEPDRPFIATCVIEESSYRIDIFVVRKHDDGSESTLGKYLYRQAAK